MPSYKVAKSLLPYTPLQNKTFPCGLKEIVLNTSRLAISTVYYRNQQHFYR